MKPIFLLGTCVESHRVVAFNLEHVVRVTPAGSSETALVWSIDGQSTHINESVEDFVATADSL